MPGDLLCWRHGLDRHRTLHEAAHALVALELEIPFVDVAVYTDLKRQPGEKYLAGGVTIRAGVPQNWVPARLDEALKMYLAGVCAENQILAHTLDGAIEGDLVQFKQGARSLDLPPTELAQRMLVTRGRVDGWIANHVDLIESVASALLSRQVLTEDDVTALVEATR